jgi:predicted nucleic acid-binding protein
MPTSYAVLDSGILLATVQTETYTEQAKVLFTRLTQEQTQIVAPTLLSYELVAVTRKLATPEQAKLALKTLLYYPLTTIVDAALLQRAYELATQFDRLTAYDAQYLAVAERYHCDFWTADERLFNAVTASLPNISLENSD